MTRKQIIDKVVETCPFCDADNSYSNWDCKQNGYIATCQKCGEQIMLCSECLQAGDNPGQICDWHEEMRNGKRCGVCFRGVTVRTEKKI